jgi:hypothetical protein
MDENIIRLACSLTSLGIFHNVIISSWERHPSRVQASTWVSRSAESGHHVDGQSRHSMP